MLCGMVYMPLVNGRGLSSGHASELACNVQGHENDGVLMERGDFVFTYSRNCSCR